MNLAAEGGALVLYINNGLDRRTAVHLAHLMISTLNVLIIHVALMGIL